MHISVYRSIKSLAKLREVTTKIYQVFQSISSKFFLMVHKENLITEILKVI